MTDAGLHLNLSACLIVKDEEERLPAALRSLDFCDEILVIDSGSADRTAELARSAGARVIEQSWLGFAAQRNVALEHAASEWVLEIDADERVTEALARAIRAFLANPPDGVDLVAMARRNIFLDRRLGPAAVYPDYRFRLLRRSAHRHDETRTVHEGLASSGRVWVLDGELEHLLAASLREALTDMVAYARLESRMIPRPVVVRVAAVGIAVRPAVKLLYRLALGGGWRDGWRGALWILRDCVSDALVWAFALTDPGSGPADSDTRLRGHFGVSKPPSRLTRVVGLACGTRAAEQASDWLARAAKHGADAVLITDAASPAALPFRARRVRRFTPLQVLQALDAERQLGPVDALLPAGWRERSLARVLPGRLRGRRSPPGLGADPVAWLRSVRPTAE
ncbi:MAG: glycosyltransferase family 2 protein [Actinomycetota bacterium]|nr:glycosyltransferase family 2 protein [Actinomycetota bacterium]